MTNNNIEVHLKSLVRYQRLTFLSNIPKLFFNLIIIIIVIYVSIKLIELENSLKNSSIGKLL